MSSRILISLTALACAFLTGRGYAGARQWPLDHSTPPGISAMGGEVQVGPGIRGKSLVLDGGSLLQLKDSTAATHHDRGFTFAVWVNPYSAKNGEQMIAAKNRYSLNEREWGVMIDKEGRYALVVRQGGNWRRMTSEITPTIGRWQHVAIAMTKTSVSMWVNGRSAGGIKLSQPVPRTQAPLTLGGVNDNGRIWQNLHGALDEAALFASALSDDEITALYVKNKERALAAERHTPTKLKTSAEQERYTLWDPKRPMPRASDLRRLENVEFYVIKPYEFKKDGYRFLHGVALIWHKGKLYASFGHNKGGENTDTEEAKYRVSSDGGKSWGPVGVIDSGSPGTAVSHGQFLSYQGTLWAFHGCYEGIMKNLRMRAYTLDEEQEKWVRRGVVSRDKFWSTQNPIRMDDGNWIMAGMIVNGYKKTPAGVSISQGDDFTKWDVVTIPKPEGGMWGESSVIVLGRRIINIARYGASTWAVAAVSEDYGRTWKRSGLSNMKMDCTKPYAGTLSTGRHFLIGTTHADCRNARTPLTIALTDPGKETFSSIYTIRPSVLAAGPGESHPKARLAYPHAVEHEGRLYVAYSNDGGNVGRVGKGRELWNNNSAEMAVIPISSLKVESDVGRAE